ncbi:hypothetical protein FRC98_11250 [Lujinxingia vulgaris]|uniref:Uncharacterized protein n=1 Tax=Lujinxingia vulgaris TaxID=2600176 RepID=A0A5C6X5Z5_9DELT|nr:hypothetical protein [Lujinxingia vulgaris]TXD37299.1 hypothetical protein FRC98_11250 [Lujinxingia vulgaris]
MTRLVFIATIALLVALASSCQSTSVQRSNAQGPPTQLRAGLVLEDARAPQGEAGHYQAPTLAERLALQEAIPQLLRALDDDSPDLDALSTRLLEAGLRLQPYPHGDHTFYSLFEAGPTWRGSGVYLFRAGDDVQEVVIQSPHSYHDRSTDLIGLALFEALNVRAFYMNSLHRYHATADFRETDDSPSDICHNSASVFHHMSTAALTHSPQLRIVQLHGFRAADRGPRAYDIIVSDGSDEPHPWTRAVVDEMNRDWNPPAGVALFPRDTTALGATGNVLGRFANLHAPGRFVHLEFSDDLRDALQNDITPLASTLNTLLSSPPSPDAP